MNCKVNLEITKQYFDKNKETMKKEFEENYNLDDTIQKGYAIELQIEGTDYDINENKISIWGEADNNWVTVELELTTELLESVLGHSIKQMNKLKTVLEAVK